MAFRPVSPARLKLTAMILAYLRPAYWVALTLGLGFIFFTLAFSQGWTDPIDQAVLNALRGDTANLDEHTPQLMIEIMRDITSLAGVGLVVLVGVLLLIYLMLRRRWRAVIVAVVLVLGTNVSVAILKDFISRPRPDLVDHGASVISHSFPSGHSAMAAAIALTLAWTGALLHRKPTVRVFCWIVGIATALIIGYSRMYLGVHWFSDVAAGLLLGAFWACLCMGIGRSLESRGRLVDRVLRTSPPTHSS